MTTDSIARQTYNLRLRSAWEADENHDFYRFHVPRCDRSKCDGSCGLKDKKELERQIRLRRERERQRREMDKQDEGDQQRKPAENLTRMKKDSTASASSGSGPGVEEPGDTDFMTGAKIRGKTSANSTPKKRKPGRVTFAE
ncbi:MAG: hypothetical protein Q9169_004654 [Polycauliona sp. 2 TL-2023]